MMREDTIMNRYLISGLVGILSVIGMMPTAEAQTLSVLYSFTGAAGDGFGPTGNLIRDEAGNLYGTTFYGGTAGLGTVFKVDATGAETVLHSFIGGTDGEVPNVGLIRDGAGNLYGTTQQGTSSNSGIAFKVTATGTETVLFTFSGSATGQFPRSGLIRDDAGNFYGTTSGGGTFELGTVFKLDAAGNETVLYSFPGGANGWGPLAGLLRDAAGNLYGTTLGGGDNVSCDCGVAFKLDATGAETVLHSFTGVDGARLGFGLTRDNVGNLYGTTAYGGITSAFCGSGCGIVFKLDATGTETILHSFTGKHDGKTPITSLLRDAAGNLFGTTEIGGTFNLGTVFKIGPTGRETVLHSFTGGADGSTPYGGLVEDAGGNLYGAALNGGAFGAGTIFKITP
jgi:uncharacterized repeat protein (TIGR03803 family)